MRRVWAVLAAFGVLMSVAVSSAPAAHASSNVTFALGSTA